MVLDDAIEAASAAGVLSEPTDIVRERVRLLLEDVGREKQLVDRDAGLLDWAIWSIWTSLPMGSFTTWSGRSQGRCLRLGSENGLRRRFPRS